jgi:A/G-specific adenine glycosylase
MSTLQEEVITWFKNNKRDLPWRESSPWGVMVSEFMLQQTPVVRVLPKWHEWMQKWPTPAALAQATPAEVITAWGRLGYPRRALRLYECAIEIDKRHHGEVPSNLDVLFSLPGIGEYTASAIKAFAFKESSLVLDINIRRVFARVLDGVEIPRNHITSGERISREELIPTHEPEVWAAGTMELGALICTAKNPKCDSCPIASRCKWNSLGYPQSQQMRETQIWHGTDRKCRGTIVQALRENRSLSDAKLKALWSDDSQVEKALRTLIADGLITSPKRGHYSLPQALSQ